MSCNHADAGFISIGNQTLCATCAHEAQRIQEQMYEEIQKHISEHVDCIKREDLIEATNILDASVGVYTFDDSAHEDAFNKFRQTLKIEEDES